MGLPRESGWPPPAESLRHLQSLNQIPVQFSGKPIGESKPMPKRGGARANAGRRAGSGRYREPTRAMRVPESLVGVVSQLLEEKIQEVELERTLRATGVVIETPAPGTVLTLDPMEALIALETMACSGIKADVVMLDPWYRRKAPSGRGAFLTEVIPLLSAASRIGQHVFLWGLPEALGRVIDHWPATLRLESWLTWYYTNVTSRGRGWRPNQQSCLHLRKPGSRIYPEAFYSERHREMAKRNRLEFKMGPLAGFDDALMSGFIKRHEQTGHPSQKPISVFERLLMMTTQPGSLVVDPTAGSGTTGVAALRLGCSAILSDRSPRWTALTRQRIQEEMLKR